MNTWEVVGLVVSSSALAALLTGVITLLVTRMTVRHQEAALEQQRLTETTRLMLDLMATAHGHPTDGREHIGVGQQCAAISMIGNVGVENKLFRVTAQNFLADFATTSERLAPLGEQWIVIGEAISSARRRLENA